MHRSLPLSSTLAALAVLVFAGAGCDGRHTADAYPDRSTESRNRADSIRNEGDQRKIAVERERQEKTAAERFRATQVRDTARRDREAIELARDQKIQPLTADHKAAMAKADQDQRSIVAASDIELRSADAAQADRIRAETTVKKAESSSKSTEETSAIARSIDMVALKAQNQLAETNAKELKALAEIDRIIDQVENHARQRNLDIDKDTSVALDGLGKESGKRMSTARATDEKTEANDRRIFSAVRSGLDEEPRRNGTVTIAVNAGVVTLDGTVATIEDRRAAVQRASTVQGAVRIDDQITVASAKP